MEDGKLHTWQERFENEHHELRKQVNEITTQVNGLGVTLRSLVGTIEQMGNDFKVYRDRTDDRSRPNVIALFAIAISTVTLLVWFATLGNSPLQIQIDEQRSALTRDINYADELSKIRDQHSNEQDKLLDNALQQEMRALIMASDAKHQAQFEALQRQVDRHQDRNHHE